MRVLVVMASPPVQDGGAAGKHAIALLRGLKRHGVDVRAVAADQYFTGEVAPDLGVELVEVERPPRSLLERLRSPGGDLLGTGLERRVREIEEEVDVVHLEQTLPAFLERRLEVPSVVHMHYRVALDRRVGPLWTGEGRWAIERASAERRVIRRFRYLLASSPVVAESLRREARNALVTTAPLALDPALYPQSPLDGEPVAGIIGTASWAPTCESMVRLIENVWPRVRAQLPRARLLVAGRGTDRLPRAEGVEIVGEVDSAVEFLHRLSVLVFPLARGSGMKIKALEAVACGVPVVTTRAGAEGLSGGRGVFVSEDDGAIAQEVVRLLQSPAEVQAMGAAAREAFLANHTPEVAVAPLLDLYERMTR